jgi:hypothetical protein
MMSVCLCNWHSADCLKVAPISIRQHHKCLFLALHEICREDGNQGHNFIKLFFVVTYKWTKYVSVFVPSKAGNLPERSTPPNITLGWKGLLGTNALAYLAPSWVMKKKSFITLTQRFSQGGDCPTKAIRLNLAWGQCYKTFILRHVRQFLRKLDDFKL